MTHQGRERTVLAMAATRRSAVLEFAVLGLLQDAPMHGYELRKRLNAVLGTFRAISYGSLYPALKDLLRPGSHRRGRARRRQRPVLSGRRAKIVYELTADGKDRFAELVSQTGPEAWEDEAFGVHLAFFGRTDAEVRVRILEGRRTRMEERRSNLAASTARNRERLDTYTLALQQHGLEGVEREVRWLNELIDNENQSSAEDPPTRRQPIRRYRGRAASPANPRVRKEQQMGSIRVAIVGVGNCASSLVQGVEYYKDADPNDRARSDARPVRRLPRQRHRVRRRVRRRRQEGRPGPLRRHLRQREQHDQDLRRAARPASPCQRGHTLDGLGKYYRETITESDEEPVDVVAALKDAEVDVLVCYLPVGSEDAAKFYAQCAIDAKVAFVNALPVFIAGTPEWAKKFTDAGVPIVGDDIKSQVGATITHRVLDQAVRGPRRHRRPHLPAQRRRQHGLQEHARARSAGVEEDLQDPVGHLADDRATSAARNVHIGP